MTTPYTPMYSDGYDYEPPNVHNPDRPHSIDLTLELEQQLDDESTPNSPAFSHSRSRPQSLDPHVLASIVTQLRSSYAEVTKERDELSAMLAETQSNELSMKDALHTLAEKCVRLETDLTASQDKNREDADAISMLRGKLEDSRRALMRLQTENRRTSQISNMTLDLSRGSPAVGGAPPSRRSSFIPVTGTAHRRISSVSEPGTASLGLNIMDSSSPPPTMTEFSQPPPSSTSNRRTSGFWARPLSLHPDLPPTVDTTELEEVRKELQALKEQLDQTKGELAEAQEAQEASETCVKALRTFIAENSIGVQTTTTGPAMPTNTPRIEPTTHKPAAASLSSRWGFKLWKVDTSNSTGTSGTSPNPQTNATQTPVSAAPLTKFGGLFSNRSPSSVAASQTDMHPHHPELVCNTSDSSSLEDVIAEPISPMSETPRTHVSVHVAGEPSTELLLFPSQIKALDPFHEPTTISPG